MKNPCWLVTDVKPYTDYTITITFLSGEKKRYDMHPHLNSPAFAPLKDLDLFLQAHAELHIVIWNDDIEIDAETLYEEGVLIEGVPCLDCYPPGQTSANDPDYYVYPAIFSYEEAGGIFVQFPDLDCATCGDDEHGAYLFAKELLGLVLYSLEEDNDPIPQPSLLSKLKLQPGEYASYVDVYMPEVRKDVITV